MSTYELYQKLLKFKQIYHIVTYTTYCHIQNYSMYNKLEMKADYEYQHFNSHDRKRQRITCNIFQLTML